MNKSTTIVGAFSNKGSSVFRETFQHSTKDVTHYFPGHMAKGERTKGSRAPAPTSRSHFSVPFCCFSCLVLLHLQFVFVAHCTALHRLRLLPARSLHYCSIKVSPETSFQCRTYLSEHDFIGQGPYRYMTLSGQRVDDFGTCQFRYK